MISVFITIPNMLMYTQHVRTYVPTAMTTSHSPTNKTQSGGGGTWSFAFSSATLRATSMSFIVASETVRMKSVGAPGGGRINGSGGGGRSSAVSASKGFRCMT